MRIGSIGSIQKVARFLVVYEDSNEFYECNAYLFLKLVSYVICPIKYFSSLHHAELNIEFRQDVAISKFNSI